MNKTSVLTDLYYGHVLARATCAYMFQNNHVAHGAQVGALIVEGDRIIGAGVNAEVAGTRYHAEEVVLQRLHTRQDLSGATMYVTLEPCNGNQYHHREHCCEQIAGRQVGRVVYFASKRLTNEGGAKYMQKQGIEVQLLNHQLLKEVAEILSYGFNIMNQRNHSPYANANLFTRLSKILYELSITMPTIEGADLEQIQAQLKVNIAQLLIS